MSRRDLCRGAAVAAIHSLLPQPALRVFSGTPSLAPLERLRSSLRGRLILPGDPDYDDARAVRSFNPTTDMRPMAVVRCAATADVRNAILFARSEGLEVAVRGGGHDILGASVCDNGLVVDLSGMNGIVVDGKSHTASVGGGARAAALNEAAEAHGLVAVLGCHPGVGVAGLTLGGGLGWFLGRYGAACDNLLGAEIVTADGQVLRASASEHRDLFWAIRGGGGNFGVATALRYQLHPLERVLGGKLAYRGDLARFLRFYRDFMETAPDALVAEISLFALDEPTVMVLVCWSGERAEGERALRPLRAFGPPIGDTIDLVPLTKLTSRPLFPSAPTSTVAPTPPANERLSDYWRGTSLRGLTDEAVDLIVSAVTRAPKGWSVGVGHYMHGEICRIGPDATALTRRKGQYTCYFDARWTNAGASGRAIEWVDESLAALRRASADATYINYLSSDSESAVRASYGDAYQRLVKLKRQYDPANFFHRNRNIRPQLNSS